MIASAIAMAVAVVEGKAQDVHDCQLPNCITTGGRLDINPNGKLEQGIKMLDGYLFVNEGGDVSIDTEGTTVDISGGWAYFDRASIKGFSDPDSSPVLIKIAPVNNGVPNVNRVLTLRGTHLVATNGYGILAATGGVDGTDTILSIDQATVLAGGDSGIGLWLTRDNISKPKAGDGALIADVRNTIFTQQGGTSAIVLDGDQGGAVLSLERSKITSDRGGIWIKGKQTVALADSEVRSSGDYGIHLSEGAAGVANVMLLRSTVEATSSNGNGLMADGGAVGTVLLAQSTVSASHGYAALVSGSGTQLTLDANYGTVLDGVVKATNGGTIDLALTHASHLTQGVQADGGVANIWLASDAVLDGGITALAGGTAALVADHGRLDGEILADAATASVRLQNGAVANGNVTIRHGGTLWGLISGADSALNGQISLDGASSSGLLTVADHGLLDADVIATDGAGMGLVVDNTQANGNLTANAATTSLWLQNGAVNNGDIIATHGGLVLVSTDHAELKGNITADGATTSIRLQNGAVANSNVTIGHGGTLRGDSLISGAGSVLNGQISLDGAGSSGLLTVADHGLLDADVIATNGAGMGLVVDNAQSNGNIIATHGSLVLVSADHALLNGGIAADASTASLQLRNGAVANGDIIATHGSLVLVSADHAQLNKGITADASTASLLLQNGAVATGDVAISSGGTLRGDSLISGAGSAVNGRVSLNGAGSSGMLTVADHGLLDGPVIATDGAIMGLVVDNAQSNGSLTADAAMASLQLQNGAAMVGRLSAVNGGLALVNVNSGARLAGDITVDASTASIQLRSGAAVDGDIIATHGSLALVSADHAQLNGGITADASTVSLHLQNGAVATSDVAISNGGTLHSDSLISGAGSAVHGQLSFDGNGTFGVLTVANHGQLDGDVTVTHGATAALVVDNTRLDLDVTADAHSLVDVSLQNGADLTAQLAGVGTLAAGRDTIWHLVGSASIGALALDGGLIDIGGNYSVPNQADSDDGALERKRKKRSLKEVLPPEAAPTAEDALAQEEGPPASAASLGEDGPPPPSPSPGYRLLTVKQLTGRGTFHPRTNLELMQGDLLYVPGSAAGEFALLVDNTGKETHDKTAALLLARMPSPDARFGLVGGKVDAGVYQYLLTQQGNDWWLTRDTSGDITPSAKAVISTLGAVPRLWYADSGALRTRLGDLRLSHAVTGGAWVRNYQRQYNISNSAGFAYTQRQTGLVLGLDQVQPRAEGNLYFGAAVGVEDATLDVASGTRVGVGSSSLSGYLSWLPDDGYYVDATVKAVSYRSHVNATMSDGRGVTGLSKALAVGGSLEIGKYIPLASNWFAEPYGRFAGLLGQPQHLSLSNGMEGEGTRPKSLQSTLGATLGRNLAWADSVARAYFGAAVTTEFVHHNDIAVNDYAFHQDFSGIYRRFIGGIAVQSSRDLQLRAEFEYAHGEKIEQPWGVTFGVRASW